MWFIFPINVLCTTSIGHMELCVKFYTVFIPHKLSRVLVIVARCIPLIIFSFIFFIIIVLVFYSLLNYKEIFVCLFISFYFIY